MAKRPMAGIVTLAGLDDIAAEVERQRGNR